MPKSQAGDDVTTVAELRELIRRFVDEREWRTFHSPKNLAMSLAIEAAELMEHFQWTSVDESRTMANDDERRGEAAEELADVVCYALAMANELGIDLSRAVRAKMVKNSDKYPVAEFRGRYGRRDTNEPKSASE